MTKIIRALWFTFALVMLSATGSWVSAESHQSIRIVKPGDRRNISTRDATVTVEIRGADAAQGLYWELYADQLPSATIRDGSASVAVKFRRTGPHRLQVALFDAQGRRVSSHEILVIAAPVEDRTDPFNRRQFAPAMAVLALVITCIIGGALWYSRRVKKVVYTKSESRNENESEPVRNESAVGESV